MSLHITQARHVCDYQVAVSFNTGEQGVADLSLVVKQGVFQSLKPIEEFAKLSVDQTLETLTWPNGLDLAPEYVYFQAFKHEPKHQTQFKAWGYIV
jgi:hypothetical protein